MWKNYGKAVEKFMEKTTKKNTVLMETWKKYYKESIWKLSKKSRLVCVN